MSDFALGKGSAGADYYLTLFEEFPALIWRSNPAGECDWFNTTWLDFTGRTMAQEYGSGWAEGVHSDDLARCVDIWMENLAARTPFVMDYRLMRHDAEYRWIRDFGRPFDDPNGEFAGFIGACYDITDLREAQNDLERSNRELEQFAYVASHDLQEPLRMVSSYMSLLKQRYEGQLDADADEFIEYAVDGAKRMQYLLEDLLSYSRVSTQGKAARRVSSSDAATQAVENLAAAIRDAGAEVVLGELPTIMADETQVMRLFQNLIGNAIKFTQSGEAARVEVSATREGALWRFCVEDNGIGIPEGNRDQVFEVFRRLNPASAYPGSGIGLAVCRRIVERLGGRIWVESSRETGTEICFTLPAVPEM